MAESGPTPGPHTASEPPGPAGSPGRVLYVQYTNPAAYPPLEHSARILADAGFEVLLIGTDALSGSLAIEPHERIRVRLRRFHARGAGQKLHYAAFLMWSIVLALRWGPTWIYASDPLSCPIAFVLRALTRAQLVYHEHDSPSEAGEARPGAFMRLVGAARRLVAIRSAVCVLPNEARAARFGRTTGRTDVLTVWNCPMLSEVTSEAARGADGTLRLFYHGSIVPARLPLTAIEALAKTPPSVSLTIAGYETAGHPGYVDTLLGYARTLGVASRIRYLGVLPRGRSLRECAQCDVGISVLPVASDDPNEDAMVGASNKTFDYMAAGLAVLVTDRPDWRETFVERGFGLACDPSSAESLASVWSTWLAHAADCVAMGTRGRQKIAAEWNYEAAFRPVLRRMTDCSAGAACDEQHLSVESA